MTKGNSDTTHDLLVFSMSTNMKWGLDCRTMTAFAFISSIDPKRNRLGKNQLANAVQYGNSAHTIGKEANRKANFESYARGRSIFTEKIDK